MILLHLSPAKVEHSKLLWLFSWFLTNSLDGPVSWCELDGSKSIFYVVSLEKKAHPPHPWAQGPTDKASHILGVVRFGLQMFKTTCQ